MSKRQVIILWAIALLLGIVVTLVKLNLNQTDDSSTRRTAGQTLFASFPAADVASIEIKGAAVSTTLRQKDGKWTVAERADYPANHVIVNEFLRTLGDLKVTQGIEAGPSFAPRFGMDESASKADDHGLLATFKDASGKEIAKVTIGKKIGADPGGFGPVSGRYIRNHADDSGFYATSELFVSVSDDPKRWISDEFIKVEQIRSIAVSEPGKTDIAWKLSRDAVDKEFSLEGAAEGETLDPSATSPLNSLFAFTRFEDVVPAAQIEARAQPEQTQTLVLETFDGFTYRVTFTPAKPGEVPAGDDPENPIPPAQDNYFFTVEVSGELPKEREKGENETPADAKTKDEAFAARLKTLSEKLEKEKTFSGRTYEVSKYTIDPVLKDRASLLKKPEPSASTPPGGVTAVTPPISIPPAPPAEEENDTGGSEE